MHKTCSFLHPTPVGSRVQICCRTAGGPRSNAQNLQFSTPYPCRVPPTTYSLQPMGLKLGLSARVPGCHLLLVSIIAKPLHLYRKVNLKTDVDHVNFRYMIPKFLYFIDLLNWFTVWDFFQNSKTRIRTIFNIFSR